MFSHITSTDITCFMLHSTLSNWTKIRATDAQKNCGMKIDEKEYSLPHFCDRNILPIPAGTFKCANDMHISHLAMMLRYFR